MTKKKKKFNQIWSNQTDLGKKFGLSSIAVGKILIEHGLKDQQTKHATDKALASGYAKSTPLKDGTPYFMWNAHKVKPLIKQKHQPLDEVNYWAREVKKILVAAEKELDSGNDKIGYIMVDLAYDEVPKHLQQTVKQLVERTS